MEDPLQALSLTERTCVRRYVSTLAGRLGADLSEVWMFQFRTREWFEDPPGERHREFAAQVRSEGSVLYRAE